MKTDYIKCPFCANKIKRGAVKCQYCEEFLDGKLTKISRESKTKVSNGIKSGNIILKVSFLTFFVLLMSFVCYRFLLSKNINLGYQIYNDGYLSFQYPSGLVVSNIEFEDFSYFDGININVVKYDYDSYLNRIIQDEGAWAIDLTEQEIMDYERQNLLKYKNIVDLAKNGNRDGSKICTYDCSWTAGIIGNKRMDIGKTPGILNNYYFTQDNGLACLSQFNTELLLFTKDYVYSIMFKYNFGDVYTFLYPYKTDYGEACLYVSGPTLENTSKILEDFFMYKTNSLEGTFVEPFERDYNIIMNIINSIKFK